MSHLDILSSRVPLQMPCLNPCCNGCRTWTIMTKMEIIDQLVLILVVMDVALGLLLI